jgi:hypothetical protein
MQITKKMPLKDLDGLFGIIHLFEGTNKITCKLLDAKSLGFYSKVILSRINNNFTVELTVLKNLSPFFDRDLGKMEKFELEMQGVQYLIKDAHIVSNSVKPNYTKVIAKFYKFSKSQNNTGFHFQRLILPCEKDIFFPFYVENTMCYKTKNASILGLLTIEIDSYNFDIFRYTIEIDSKKKFYLIIDSANEMTLEVFQNYAYSILMGFGYITGSFVQNIGFYFSYDKHQKLQGIQVQGKRKSVYTFLSPVYKNPYGVFQNQDFHEKYYDIIRGLTSSELSKLCQLINDSEEIKVIILLILESCAATQIIQPAGFAVALEGFSAFTKKEIEKEREKLSPKLSSKILGDLKSILINNKEELGDSFYLFCKKIEQINQPTNKDALLKPFEYLKIPINELDKQTIAHRNDLLHGRYDLKSTYEGKNNDSYRFSASLRLYTLLSALILKYVGFDNRVINHPKRSDSLNIATEEEPFRQI